MATLFFFIALVFSMPFHFSAESDGTKWKPLKSLPRGAFHSWFTKDQIQRANEYFLTLNDTEKLDLFGNWSGIDLGKRTCLCFCPVRIYIQLLQNISQNA